MKIMIDLDPKDVWRITERAERENRTPGDIVREILATKRTTLQLHDRVRARVLAGMCDADIAAELGMSNGSIAGIRRGQGLPANPRYPKTNERKTA